MAFPHHERALRTEHVLLPPHLTQVRARDRTPLLVGGLDLGELKVARISQHEPVGRGQVPRVVLRVEERLARLDAVFPEHPRRDDRLARLAVVGEGVA